mmetsp:Transcript_553/g.1921  ORF Transcript_553/g.1921 Transcript_553/m.1921 type:complete len:250 (+) Transcript_553:56-805(+)
MGAGMAAAEGPPPAQCLRSNSRGSSDGAWRPPHGAAPRHSGSPKACCCRSLGSLSRPLALRAPRVCHAARAAQRPGRPWVPQGLTGGHIWRYSVRRKPCSWRGWRRAMSKSWRAWHARRRRPRASMRPWRRRRPWPRSAASRQSGASGAWSVCGERRPRGGRSGMAAPRSWRGCRRNSTVGPARSASSLRPCWRSRPERRWVLRHVRRRVSDGVSAAARRRWPVGRWTSARRCASRRSSFRGKSPWLRS